MDNFSEKYSLVARTDNLAPEIVGQIKRCRFCNETEPNVTFHEETHLLPELLGENDIIHYDECDACNKKFSAYESHLAVFVRPSLTMLNIKGKSKVPKFNSRGVDILNSQSTTVFSENNKIRKVFLGNIADYTVDEVSKKGALKFRQTPFNPLKVYKVLVKIGLSLLPIEQRDSYENSFKWLLNQHETIEYIKITFITTLMTKKFKTPFASLYEANNLIENNQEYPKHTIILGFANLVFQYFLPFSIENQRIHDSSMDTSIDLFPAWFFDDPVPKNPNLKYIDLSVDKNVKLDSVINFSFSDIEKKNSR